MCIAGIVLNAHPDIPLLIIHNRDEQTHRSRHSTSPFGIDPVTSVLCASDHTHLPRSQLNYLRERLGYAETAEIAALLFNRSWLGLKKVDQHPREVLKFSFLTNNRQCAKKDLSRGVLIPYCLSSQPSSEVLQEIVAKCSGVNLFSGSVRYTDGNPWPGVDLVYRSNATGSANTPQSLTPGVHVVSNSVLDDFSWPKVSYLRNRMTATILPLFLSDHPSKNVGRILQRSADLLCEVPQIAVESKNPSGKLRPGELQKQLGVYTRSTSRRSRSVLGVSKAGKGTRRRVAVDDAIAWRKTGVDGNDCFQTTMQTIFCVHKSVEDDGNGNPSMDCTVMFRETFDAGQHGEWRKTVLRLPRCSLEVKSTLGEIVAQEGKYEPFKSKSVQT